MNPMTSGSNILKPSARSGWDRVCQILAILFALFVIEQDVETLLWDLRLMPDAGSLDTRFTRDLTQSDGTVVVTTIQSYSPLRQVGVVKGDHLRFDHVFDYIRRLRAGEKVGLTLKRAGQKSHQEVIAALRVQHTEEVGFDRDSIFLDLTSLFTALVGTFMVIRAQGRATA